ncbi:MAG: toll/interleukin-1 receptor domain-containing protein [Thermoanaerobaculia bacterium]|nr:toll/interleukin-1 receptor domain-containing protein [Thermoanaerobaculia bacterium]
MAEQPPLAFIIYSREDEAYRVSLKKHLAPLEQDGLLRVWSDDRIAPGDDWESAIMGNFKQADIILLLVSSNFFASKYIQNVEFREARKRHDRQEAVMIPIIVSHCMWNTTALAGLQALPKDGVPVDDASWGSSHKAWLDTVRGIQTAINKLQKNRAEAAARHKQAEAAEAKEKAAAEQRAAEENAWYEAQTAGGPDALDAYLAHYPNGRYAPEARRRIKQLQRAVQKSRPFPLRMALSALLTVTAAVLLYLLWPRPVQTEQPSGDSAAWATTRQAGTIPAYRDFLQNHPAGPHRADAEKMLRALEKSFDAHRADALNLLENELGNAARAHVDSMLRLWPANPAAEDARRLIDSDMYQEAARTLK